MEPIEADIVLFFQASWLILVALLIRYILKLKSVINSLRGTLAPFAMVWERGAIKEENVVFLAHSFKRAFEVYTKSH